MSVLFGRKSLALVLAVPLFTSGCGSGSGSSVTSGQQNSPKPAVVVTPATASIAPGATQQFVASVANSTSGVNWLVDGVQGGSAAAGTISAQGVYTAPAASGTHTVTAQLASDGTVAGNASISVTGTPSVAIAPTAATLTVGATQQFTSTVSNSSDTTTWLVDGVQGGNATVGTISATGVYTAPSTAGTHTVTAQLSTQGTVTATANVTVTAAASVTLAPATATIAPGATQQFSATVANAASNAVNWLVDGVQGGSAASGTITAAGLYTAPAATGTHTVTAQLASDTAITGTATVTIAAGATIAISPTTATVAGNATQQFTATVSNATDTTVTWLVDDVQGGNATVGTITAAGLYTAPASGGTHTITAQLSSQATVTATAAITVNAGQTCTAAANTVAICSPANGASVTSPVSFSAVATAPDGQTITAMALYVDSVSQGQSTSGTLNTSVTLNAGSHAVQVNAWTSTGALIFAKETITVGSSSPSTGAPGMSMYTYQYNNARNGLNDQETVLTPANVSGGKFGKQGTWTLDGAIQAQPLYVSGVLINGVKKNVLYVATEGDSVYALDADTPNTVLWKRNFLENGATLGRSVDSTGRTAVGYYVGITGTPVIDPSSNRLYVVTRTTENNAQIHRLQAIDITTGTSVVPSVVLSATSSGTGDDSNNGTIKFNNLTANQRPGLVLVNGVVYVTTASFSDYRPYHGWVLAYDAATLNFIDAFNVTPNTSGGGIWQSGAAPSADADGNIYFATGNEMPYAITSVDFPGELANALVKLKLVNGKLTLADWFAPYNAKCLTNDDLDLGSSAPALIPDQFGGMNLVALGTKEGRAYLLNRDSLGQFNSAGDTQIPSSILFNVAACGQSGFNANAPQRVYGPPAYWNGYVYMAGDGGPLRQFSIANAKLSQTAVSTHTFAQNGQSGRGPIPVVSSNGATNPIVWTVETDLSGNGWLRAYDGTNVANELFNVNFGGGLNFIVPTVINGKVFFTGKNVVYVYGLN